MDRSPSQALVPLERYVAWTLALLGTVGSLFFSEVMGLPPCVLCWYQRIALYPLVLLLGTSIARRERNGLHYVWPLATFGLLVSVYHNLLYYGILPESIAPCTKEVSCTSHQFEALGFVTIPLLSLSSFVAIIVLVVRDLRAQPKGVST